MSVRDPGRGTMEARRRRHDPQDAALPRTSAEEPEELARRAPDLALGTEKPKEYAD
jgi:hypothetical protein